MTYEDGIWESENATKVFELIAKLGTYTEGTTVANANNDNFTKNQQLILDNKAIFCPNGTWLPGEMAEAPRADGFEWGFMPIPAVNAGGAGCSFCWFEQMWIPAAAQNQDMAKEFVAYMYSDEAAQILQRLRQSSQSQASATLSRATTRCSTASMTTAQPQLWAASLPLHQLRA